MAASLERQTRVLSHDFYQGPTEQQLEMIERLSELQAQYAELIAANPLFKAAVHTWVEHEHDDDGTLAALSRFKLELDEDVEGMTKAERAANPDGDLHKMVKLRLEIAILKQDIQSSAQVTGVPLQHLLPHAA